MVTDYRVKQVVEAYEKDEVDVSKSIETQMTIEQNITHGRGFYQEGRYTYTDSECGLQRKLVDMNNNNLGTVCLRDALLTLEELLTKTGQLAYFTTPEMLYQQVHFLQLANDYGRENDTVVKRPFPGVAVIHNKGRGRLLTGIVH